MARETGIRIHPATMSRAVIGVDVSKAKLDVAWGPHGPLENIDNTPQQIRLLIDKIVDRSRTLVVLEATGSYENALVNLLHQADIAVAVVNPRRVRDFARGIGRDAKTDPIDAALIAYYGEVAKPAPQVAKTDDVKKARSAGHSSSPTAGLDQSGK